MINERLTKFDRRKEDERMKGKTTGAPAGVWSPGRRSSRRLCRTAYNQLTFQFKHAPSPRILALF